VSTNLIPEEEITAALELIARRRFNYKGATNRLAEITSGIAPENIAPFENFLRWKIVSLKYQLKPKKWQFWRAQPDFPHWVNIGSENGYEREKAILSSQDGAPNAIFLALLVRRLNDWVPQVRTATERKIVTIAEKTDPQIVAQVLCAMLSRWNSWQRWSDAEKSKLIELIELERVAIALGERITSSISGPMAVVLSQACRCKALDKQLPVIANSAVQPAVRAKAYRMLLEQKARWLEGRKWKWTDIRYSEGRHFPQIGEREIQSSLQIPQLVELALKDQAVAVRRVGAEKFIQNLEGFGTRAEEIAKTIARDKSKSVAERGRFAERALNDLGDVT